jgi:rare lipoprotein A (peptidoglycan hydrolase)
MRISSLSRGILHRKPHQSDELDSRRGDTADMRRLLRWSPALLAACVAGGAVAATPKVQVGKASIYSKKFAGRKMANGERMDPGQDNAAHRTLPLGSKARVTNLETGKSAIVTIEDRGPHIPGRIVDLSPATAEKIGLDRKDGVAHVELRPIAEK